MPDKTLKNQITGMRIKEIMDIRGVAVEDIANACSKEVNTVRKWLSGINGIKPDCLQIIARLLDIKPEILESSIIDLSSESASQQNDQPITSTVEVEGHVHIHHPDGFSQYLKMTLAQVIQLSFIAIRISAGAWKDGDNK